MAKKEDTIIVRVTFLMKAQLEQLAKESKRELSDYLRRILEDVIQERKKI